MNDYEMRLKCFEFALIQAKIEGNQGDLKKVFTIARKIVKFVEVSDKSDIPEQ